MTSVLYYIDVIYYVSVFPCGNLPCLNGGTCENPAVDVYQCVCANNFTGFSCELFAPAKSDSDSNNLNVRLLVFILCTSGGVIFILTTCAVCYCWRVKNEKPIPNNNVNKPTTRRVTFGESDAAIEEMYYTVGSMGKAWAADFYNNSAGYYDNINN